MQTPAATTSSHSDTRSGGVAPVPLASGHKDKASSSVGPLAPSKAQSPTSSDGAPPSPAAMRHMNAAVLNGVTYPSAKAAAIAKEAVEAAQLYYNLFFQASEEASASAGGGGGAARDGRAATHQPHCGFPTTTITAAAAAAVHSSHSPTRQRGLEQAGEDHAPAPTATEKTKLRCVVLPEDSPPSPHRSTAGAGRHHSREANMRFSRTSSVNSNEASLLNVQTPVNVVDTTYHTFFPPLLSQVKREAIVERIVGHRPRPYLAWQWRKAEDYHTLHAQNVHHNNAYHEYPSHTTTVTIAGVGGKVGVASPVASVASAKATLETPLSTSPSSPMMGPTARVGDLNGTGTTAEANAASPVRSVTPTPANSLRATTAPSLNAAAAAAAAPGTEEEKEVEPEESGGVYPLRSDSSSADGGAPAAAAMPKVSSFLLNEMPFELMSQLSMYTIPTSQQGPEYFKKTAEDGTKTLIIFMMGLPARGKTFLAQKICRLLGWHGSRAKVQNIQVAWRRVLLDWEATHADRLATEQRDKATEGETSCECCGHDAAAPDVTAAVSAHAAAANSAPATDATADARGTRQDYCRAHALSGQRPSHSTTQDEVSRVVRDVATGRLSSAPLRRPAEGGGRAAPASALPSPSPAGRSSPAPPTTKPLRTSSGTSPVCPSMEPYTVVSRQDRSSSQSPTSSVVASPTAALSDCASNVAVAGSPREATLHSHPVSPMSTGVAVPDAAVLAEENPIAVAAAAVAAAAAEADADAAADRPTMPAEVLRTRHFKELIQNPTSVARRMYRYVLQSFADDCRLFFQHGGEVVVINDDFVTEELRQEAERLFRPLAAQFFYMEVIRDVAEDPLDFVQCKIRDPMEYPRSEIDLHTATSDFTARLHFLEQVYETLEEAPKTAAEAQCCRPAHSPPPKTPRSYVKIRNANTIETHGISGYLPSRIISYVMNLSQVKIQHPIFFVRHGESCYNLENRIGGNPLLTEQGMRDAGALLEFLASLKHQLQHIDQTQRAQATPRDENSHAHGKSNDDDDTDAPTVRRSAAAGGGTNTANTLEMWTSQLRRAIQTAELSERLLNIRTLRWSSLNEIHAGVCEDMTYDEVIQRYPLIDYFRKRNKYTFRYPEGESYQDLVVRLEPVIMELENADKVVVVVAHQAVLRCLLAYFGSTSAESSISVEVPHRTVWRCTYDSKGIASLDELKLDNYEAGFQLRKPGRAPTPGAAAASIETASEASAVSPPPDAGEKR
ncbi:putative mitochondrial 6-phosphofructo-2-kinase-like protein [Leptomonas pyrrhocoris]|uniref:Putative mitochondrial 6-phosphofructo-2-kinase-like protein n=1 Tax=Leptomonas pyrrhocoris TaxID=157538 RepID=A0A0N0DR85_LEPPY|nr:putative mitochondrial 6-phosphofructo-2-kinase-like protein [Leptomonas pyrrhocoris]KPA74288.1 putative mitochondrial 6-phosphofructo-2-kinase-like protein [Leptomonas pyrrhocoris]|eukprot:XP_015652727.1 putative mitochondrial 6-phosphofructo-2-kinase-like protein [Leptomonas pyrrhocoris]